MSRRAPLLRRLACVAPLALALSSGSACRAPGGPPAPDATGSVSGTVSGTVRDAATGAPLPGTAVVVVGTSSGMQATAGGRFLLGGIAAGARTVRADRCGYRPVERRVRVTAGGGATVELALAPLAGGCRSRSTM